jgi:hypothetical protein
MGRRWPVLCRWWRALVSLELLVVDVTLDGNRRPSKVARLQSIREQRILAAGGAGGRSVEGVDTGPQWDRGDEGRKQESPRHVADLGVQASRAREGSRLSGQRHVHQASPFPRRGPGGVARAADWWLPATTQCAQRNDVRRLQYQISTFPQKRLINCGLLWMSDSTFRARRASRQSRAHGDRPNSWSALAGCARLI